MWSSPEDVMGVLNIKLGEGWHISGTCKRYTGRCYGTAVREIAEGLGSIA
jgi:hypothetical protein